MEEIMQQAITLLIEHADGDFISKANALKAGTDLLDLKIQIQQAKKGKLTLQECKDEIANKYHNVDWDILELSEKIGLNDIVSETYANQFIPAAPAEQWIFVKDRLPESEQKVIIFLEDKVTYDSCIQVVRYGIRNFVGISDPAERMCITHWMPLPAAPESTTSTKKCKRCSNVISLEEIIDVPGLCQECTIYLDNFN